jgi:hypothetical protein
MIEPSARKPIRNPVFYFVQLCETNNAEDKFLRLPLGSLLKVRCMAATHCSTRHTPRYMRSLKAAYLAHILSRLSLLMLRFHRAGFRSTASKRRPTCRGCFVGLGRGDQNVKEKPLMHGVVKDRPSNRKLMTPKKSFRPQNCDRRKLQKGELSLQGQLAKRCQ